MTETLAKLNSLGLAAKKMNVDAVTPTHFYWFLFGKASYIDSKQFLGMIPWHDFIFCIVQFVMYGQMSYFFFEGPMFKVTYSLLTCMIFDVVLIIAAICFYCRKTREIIGGR